MIVSPKSDQIVRKGISIQLSNELITKHGAELLATFYSEAKEEAVGRYLQKRFKISYPEVSGLISEWLNQTYSHEVQVVSHPKSNRFL
jgi:hypothetical protein